MESATIINWTSSFSITRYKNVWYNSYRNMQTVKCCYKAEMSEKDKHNKGQQMKDEDNIRWKINIK